MDPNIPGKDALFQNMGVYNQKKKNKIKLKKSKYCFFGT